MSEQEPIDLGEHDSGSRLDYRIKFKNVPTGAQLDDHTVTIESAGNGESPPALSIPQDSIVADGAGRQIEVLFWLEGGTKLTRYLGKIVASDSESTDPDREYVEYFTVLVT